VCLQGGWGSIEYASPRPGMVLGGRWKPLQYWYMNTLYQDVIVACGNSTCYVKNDRSMQTLNGTVVVQAFDLVSNSSTQLVSTPVSLGAGPGSSMFFSVDTSSLDPTRHILVSQITDLERMVVATNWNLLGIPASLKTNTPSVRVTVADALNPDGTVTVVVSSDAPAMFVTLTTLAHGRFSDNAFIMPAGSRSLTFIPFGGYPTDLKLLRATLREEDLSTYIH
jgi:beta-mannosidase